jgi:hypothetical protein
VTTEDRTLLLNPYDHLGFLDVQVLPDKIDWQVMESITVQLRYEDSAGWAAKKDVLLTSGAAAQRWRLRLSKKNELAYTYRVVHRLKDGTEKVEGPFLTQATALPISDPLPGELAIEFVPLFPKAGVSMVFIDLRYEDAASNYKREERLRIAGNAVEPVPLRIALFDPKRRRFSYRLTFVREGAMDQRAFIETDETLVGIV